MTCPRRLLLLMLLLPAAWAWASAAEDLAQAVRCYYDEGAEPASRQLLALVERLPGRDDAAWWLARCQLDLDHPEAALPLLEGRTGENIPSWRFPALEAQAALRVGEEERAAELATRAMVEAPESAARDGLLAEARWVAAGLAVRRGDHSTALELLLALDHAPEAPLAIRAALPELANTLALPLATGASLPAPLWLEAQGRGWVLPAGGGLARAGEAPAPSVLECDGPDLCDAAGAPLMPQPGVRHGPSVVDGLVLYSAGYEPLDAAPEVPGLFLWRPGGAPQRLTRAPEGAQDLLPVAGPQDRVFFVRLAGTGTTLMRVRPDEEPEALAPDLEAIHALAVVGDQVVLAVVRDGASSLCSLPVDAAPGLSSRALVAVPLEVWSLRSLSP